MCGLATLIVLALGGALAWQNLQERQGRHPPSPGERKDVALRILDQRYARGEIGREEYEERRRTIVES